MQFVIRGKNIEVTYDAPHQWQHINQYADLQLVNDYSFLLNQAQHELDLNFLYKFLLQHEWYHQD